jgi:ubiquinone/menaquinone biosynthesis C-methylase UbiE
VLCTVRDQRQALKEIRRVLVPGGRLLFIEHVRSDNQRLARWQDRLNGLNRLIAHGCHCNRNTEETMRVSGFRFESLHRGELAAAPPFVRPLITGSALAD